MNVPAETAEIRPSKGELDSRSYLLRGPFSVGLTHTPQGEMPPHTVCCGTGQAVAGHVPSKAIAEAIAKALNAAYHFE